MIGIAALFFCSILLHDVEASKDGCPPIVQQSNHFSETFGNTCYLFVDQEVYWNDARDSCWDMGGELLAVRNYETMQFIKLTLNSMKLGWRNQGVWLGARYYSGVWKWTTGEKIDFEYWSPGQPSKILGLLSVEDCALMRREDGWRWHDYLCGSLKFHYRYVCQFRLVHTTTTTASTTAAVAEAEGPRSVGVLGEPEGQQPLDLKGQTAESRVSDNSVGSGLTGCKAFSSVHHAAHSTATEEDNGNMAVLTIMLIVGGTILLGLLLILLFVRRRYHNAIKHEGQGELAVHFANRSFSSSHNMVPPPCPHVFPRCHEDSLYLTPVASACTYEEIKKPEAHWTSSGAKDFDSFQESAPFAPARYCSSDLGACGGMLDEVDDSPDLPLVSADTTRSVENLDSRKCNLKLQPENMHDDYVDMNGMAVTNSNGSSATASKESLHGSMSSNKAHKADMQGEYAYVSGHKADMQGEYAYVNGWKSAPCENVYEALK